MHPSQQLAGLLNEAEGLEGVVRLCGAREYHQPVEIVKDRRADMPLDQRLSDRQVTVHTARGGIRFVEDAVPERMDSHGSLHARRGADRSTDGAWRRLSD